ncbi:metalloprotease [Candidatus Woesearchaeota archaeon]|nr:metalloprotease [Candidatus Woesearchaeota archaeon]
MTSFRKFRLRFSPEEWRDLGVALLVVSLAFTFAQRAYLLPDFSFFSFLVVSIIIVGVGFLLHELAHKIVAQRFGCEAVFKADYKMLMVTILLSFFGVVFAAPGGVFITGHLKKREHGLISAAGPVTNIILACLFLSLSAVGFSASGKHILLVASLINSWLALFNLLPFWTFDGAKVIQWSKKNYVFLVLIALALQFFTYFFIGQ